MSVHLGEALALGSSLRRCCLLGTPTFVCRMYGEGWGSPMRTAVQYAHAYAWICCVLEATRPTAQSNAHRAGGAATSLQCKCQKPFQAARGRRVGFGSGART